MDNQHKKIAGYRDLNENEIEAMNDFKKLEISTLAKLDSIVDKDGTNGRHVALAKTHFETAFMFAIKAIAKPAPYYVERTAYAQAEAPEALPDDDAALDND